MTCDIYTSNGVYAINFVDVCFIGAFYFNLGNLCPQYRSVINMIQLVALCPVPYINTYGMNKILQPFMRDISLLESVSKTLVVNIIKTFCPVYMLSIINIIQV